MAQIIDEGRDLVPAVRAYQSFVARDLVPAVRAYQSFVARDLVPTLLVVRDVITASRTETLDEALRDLDAESIWSPRSVPGSVHLDSDQLQKLATYLIALHVLVVAAVLQAYHPGVVQAVADLLAWTTVVFVIADQARRGRR